GMDARSGDFIRPLLRVPHADLVAYLRERGLTWVEDPSNAAPKYLRNRMRHELLPLLNDLAGGAIAARLGTLEVPSQQLAAWLERQPMPKQSGDGTPAWIDIAGLRRLPELARGHALEQFIQGHAPGDLRAEDIQQALHLLEHAQGPKRDRWTLHLPAGRHL